MGFRSAPDLHADFQNLGFLVRGRCTKDRPSYLGIHTGVRPFVETYCRSPADGTAKTSAFLRNCLLEFVLDAAGGFQPVFCFGWRLGCFPNLS